MKKKHIAVLFALLAAAAFGGCKSASAKPQETLPAKPEDSIQTVTEETSQAVTEESIAAKAEAAYRALLLAAPAIDTAQTQLQDASFNYEQNMKLFGNHYDMFALTDIDGDGIPELIAQTVVNFRWTPVSVFTYADGEAVLLKDPRDAMAHGTFEQCSTAGGGYTTYLCGENHIHSVWKGMTPVGEMEEDYAYTLSGTELSETDCPVGINERAVYFPDIAKPNTEANLP